MYRFTVVFYDEDGEIVGEEDMRASNIDEVEEWAEANKEEYGAESYIVA